MAISASVLIRQGMAPSQAAVWIEHIKGYLSTHSAEQTWHFVSQELLNPSVPFSIHLYLFSEIYPNWHKQPLSAPAIIPTARDIRSTNLYKLMQKNNFAQYEDFHQWSVSHFPLFWQQMLIELDIVLKKSYQALFAGTTEQPVWLLGAKLNIVDSCFTAAEGQIAIIQQGQHQSLQKITYGELNRLSNRIANSLGAQSLLAGDAIAINMTMSYEAVACYLGIIKMGGVVVSIADSFSSEEIASRLRIAKTKAIFTQIEIQRGAKKLPLYQKVVAANAPPAFVWGEHQVDLRSIDLHWDDFLSPNDTYVTQACDPQSHCNILFSSGTTGTPKAIPWSHCTGIKAASDGYLHQNIQAGDILAWPSNLGWMMGPWLVFAALINQATMAIYTDVPKDEAFCRFVSDAKVTMLGVIPTLVATWRQSNCLENIDWSSITRFTSTGECSNAEDMLYLMSRANYKPVIEYCGGTEIGGSYVTSTLIQHNYPAVFSTPALGLDFVLLDEVGLTADYGEVAICSPSLGLSMELLNADHHEIYYANMPTTTEHPVLRRHGDLGVRLGNGYYQILGRADDTMNLGGIKVSSAELERAMVGIPGVLETAAVAVIPSGGGPTQLAVYAVTLVAFAKEDLLPQLQQRINVNLNPLFKIHELIIVKELPKTASHKIMRRMLRR